MLLFETVYHIFPPDWKERSHLQQSLISRIESLTRVIFTAIHSLLYS